MKRLKGWRSKLVFQRFSMGVIGGTVALYAIIAYEVSDMAVSIVCGTDHTLMVYVGPGLMQQPISPRHGTGICWTNRGATIRTCRYAKHTRVRRVVPIQNRNAQIHMFVHP